MYEGCCMFKDVRSLKAFIAYCKKENISSFKAGGIELVFGSAKPVPNETVEPEIGELTPEELKKQETEELFWSTPSNRI